MADRQRQTSEIDRQVIRDVNTVGWHVIPVPPGERSPGWAFSIGLFHNHQHPEIILFGLPAETLMPRLSQLCTDVAAGESYRPGATSRDVLDGYICEFRPVHERWLVPFLGHAGWFYGGRDFPVVQCLWPDRNGRLPDHPRFELELLGTQPLLEHEHVDRARARGLLESIGLA